MSVTIPTIVPVVPTPMRGLVPSANRNNGSNSFLKRILRSCYEDSRLSTVFDLTFEAESALAGTGLIQPEPRRGAI